MVLTRSTPCGIVLDVKNIGNEPSVRETLARAGFRFGDRGTHTARTIMLSELSRLLAVVPTDAERQDYATAIIEANVLGKQTLATCRLTNQRLGELYGLDPALPIFRVLRRLWSLDEEGRPLLAMLCALARDPLLRTTAHGVLSLPYGGELVRTEHLETIREAAGDRLNDATLDKVARNTASSWTQSGHLEGRVRKVRRRVRPTVGPLSMALWLGSLEGRGGIALLSSPWCTVLDARGEALTPLVLNARQAGLVQARIGGGVVEIDARAVDPLVGGS